MAVDLTTIDPSEFIAFRDNWLKESGLDSVGADRLFENAGLTELVELDAAELKEYGQEIGLSVIERKRLIKGINRLNGIAPKTVKTPHTPVKAVPSISTSSSSKKSKKKRNSTNNNGKTPTKRDSTKQHKRKRTKSRAKMSPSASPKPKSKASRKKSADKTSTDHANDAPMYDPTNKTTPPSKPTPVPNEEMEEIKVPKKDIMTLINEAMSNLSSKADLTKSDIRKTFMEFRQTLTEREMKLIHDVDSTVDKKTRLLQTQLEYVKESNDKSNQELACDPNMNLKIEKDDILRTLVTAGWIEGASSDNKEEQLLQERERKRRELHRQQFLTVERLKEITIHEKECKTKRADSVRLTSEIQDEIAKINVRTNKCEAELALAKPLLEEAKKLVASISKRQLDEIRVLKKPPAVVELVMSAVAVMLGNKIKSWKDIQKCLSNAKFIPNVMNFDTMTLKKKTREECIKYVKHEDFNEERANKASKVAGPLVKWVKSQIKYSELLDIVRPMQKEIKVLKKKLDKKQKQLKMCINVIDDLEMKINKARTEINEMVENMIKMQDEYDLGADYKKKSELEAKVADFERNISL